MSLQRRVRAALGDGRPGDPLLPLFGEADRAWALAHLRRGAPAELRPSRDGVVPLTRGWSSTALVAQAFAPWHRDPPGLRLAGLDGFTAVRLEERLHIPHGGGTPNLDVALERADGTLVGVEAKLTEHLAARAPRAWKPAYHRPAMAEALTGGWRSAFEALRDGAWAPRHLDAGQLVRHALSLHGREGAALVYLFWDHPALDGHAADLDELRRRVGDAPPHLHVATWQATWEAWGADALRARYGVAAA